MQGRPKHPLSRSAPPTTLSLKGRGWVLIAQIGAAHGVRGEVRVKSFAAEPASLADYRSLLDKDGRLFEIERLRPLKGDMLVVKFSGIDDRRAAEALNRLPLFVERSALPATGPEEFYHADLIGLEALDPAGTPLGVVTAVRNFGAGDILEITPARGGSSLLVPFTRTSVPDIDIAKGRLTVVRPGEVEATQEDAAKEER